LTQFSGRTG